MGSVGGLTTSLNEAANSAREELALALRYEADHAQLDPSLRLRFVPMHFDPETAEYLARCARFRGGVLKTALQRTLRCYMSDFNANGVLDMYPMYLLGTERWRQLLGPTAGRLLDVGAGSGDITVKLAPLFDRVTTTEVSGAMSFRLRRRGFECASLDVALEGVPNGPYDVITCLNVLDRTRYPRRLLDQLRNGLAPGGRLVVAMPLPYDPVYYDGARTLPPEEPLGCRSETWESAAAELIYDEIERVGLHVTHFTRAPYLSGGDSKRALYELDDLVAVCERS